MKLFDWIFRKNAIEDIPPLPSWETLIEMMHDKNLDAFADEVIEVVYSIDKSMRYVILKNDKGFFTYQLEAIYQYDEDDWKYICLHDNALPAMWEPFRGIEGKSLFDDINELKKELAVEPEYIRSFK